MSYPKIKKGMGGSNSGKNRYDRTAVLKKISKKKRREQAKVESRMRQLHRQPRADDSLPKSILEIAKEHGIDTSRVRDNQDIVDVLSGKRTHED